MTLSRYPFLLALLLAACGPQQEQKPTADPGPGEPETPPVKRDVEAPAGGIAMIQDAHDDLVEEIEKQEARKKSGEGVDVRLLQSQLKLVDNLVTACEIAVRNEAEQILRRRYGNMRAEYGRMHAKVGTIGEEIQEVRGILGDAEAGGRIPEGFTEDELRDRLGDLEEALRQQRKGIEEYETEMRKVEDTIASGKFEPPADGTVFTQELAALKKTRDRVKSLLP